jgi:hypothetical protein
VKSYKSRKVRDLPISGKKMVLEVEIRQFECDCGNYFNEPFGFVRPHKKLTIRYEEDLYFRSKGAELSYVSKNSRWIGKRLKRCSAVMDPPKFLLARIGI